MIENLTQKEHGRYFFGLLVAFIISVTTICLNSNQADNSPARPMAALGLISSSLVIFLGASAFLWLEKFISSRKELSEEVNRKVEKLIKKRLMENEEILNFENEHAEAILVTYRKKIGECIRGKDEVIDNFAGGMARYVRLENSNVFVLEKL